MCMSLSMCTATQDQVGGDPSISARFKLPGATPDALCSVHSSVDRSRDAAVQDAAQIARISGGKSVEPLDLSKACLRFDPIAK